MGFQDGTNFKFGSRVIGELLGVTWLLELALASLSHHPFVQRCVNTKSSEVKQQRYVFRPRWTEPSLQKCPTLLASPPQAMPPRVTTASSLTKSGAGVESSCSAGPSIHSNKRTSLVSIVCISGFAHLQEQEYKHAAQHLHPDASKGAHHLHQFYALVSLPT